MNAGPQQPRRLHRGARVLAAMTLGKCGAGMTFCLGITVEDGLVGIADTRVLSGSESLVAKKVATYQGPGFSFFIMNSGLRSLRDKSLLYFEEVYTRQIAARDRLFKIVNLYAGEVRRPAEEEGPSLRRADFDFNIYSL